MASSQNSAPKPQAPAPSQAPVNAQDDRKPGQVFTDYASI